jgi:hypothetical protein
VGGSVSFLTFPDRGLVVAVTTNISFADTRWMGLRIAEAFATALRLGQPQTSQHLSLP